MRCRTKHLLGMLWLWTAVLNPGNRTLQALHLRCNPIFLRTSPYARRSGFSYTLLPSRHRSLW